MTRVAGKSFRKNITILVKIEGGGVCEEEAGGEQRCREDVCKERTGGGVNILCSRPKFPPIVES